jgi:UTP--glucose-1-phosphate uridylyltransferase
MTDHKLRIAVIPIAGKGKRMRPLTLVMPKEMLPTADGPIIETVVRELIQSGIETIVLVTAPGKEMIEQHLAAVDLPKTTSGKGVELKYIHQDDRPGNGGAILTAAQAIGDEPFLVVWGDEVFLGDDHRAKQLIDAFNTTNKPVIALTEVRDEDIPKCGMAAIKNDLGGGLYELSALIEKPTAEDAPSRLASVGGYVVTPDVVSLLKNIQPSGDGELYLSTALNEYSQKRPLFGQRVSAEWHETGSMAGYTKAFLSVAKRKPELARHINNIN